MNTAKLESMGPERVARAFVRVGVCAIVSYAWSEDRFNRYCRVLDVMRKTGQRVLGVLARDERFAIIKAEHDRYYGNQNPKRS